MVPNFLLHIPRLTQLLWSESPSLTLPLVLAVVSAYSFSSYPLPDSYWVNFALAFLKAEKVGAAKGKGIP